MRKQLLPVLLTSVTVAGLSLAGCSGSVLGSRASLGAAPAQGGDTRVEKALAGKDYARALLQAEELVAIGPNDPTYRALLGRSYLANGRYVSARTAFKDAMTLGNRDVRTIISLALSETGLGNAEGARELLMAHISDLPAADYGLAMAMAGDEQEGVRALLEAVKQPEATAQTRQNLAYALALAGAWGQARLVAGQDLPAREAEQRIGQWSQQALHAGREQRVYAMVGVTPRADDSGVPARLALRPAVEEPAQLASTGDLAPRASADIEETAAVSPAVDTALVVPVNLVAEAPQPAPQTEPVGLVNTAAAVSPRADIGTTSEVTTRQATSDPMREAVRTSFQRSQTSAPAPLAGQKRAATSASPMSQAQTSDWVIQLGAYDSDAVARAKWQLISRSRAKLAGFRVIFSEASSNGRVFHRLAIRGFGDRASAATLCKTLLADGQACFVRLDDAGSARMAGTSGKAFPAKATRKPVNAPKQVALR